VIALESAELFRNLRAEELKVLRQVTLERRFTNGQEIFREGEPGDGVYVVKAGSVEISGMLNQDTRRVFSTIGPGGVFGEMAVIEHRPRSATASAVGDTEVYFFPRGELLTLIERSPGLALSLLQQVSHRLREFNRQYLNEVVQAERMAAIGRFARSIVHDLKNPLNIINLNTAIVCMPDVTTDTRAEAQRRIRRQFDRINELVSEILDFAHGVQATVELVPTDYAAYIEHMVDELRQDMALKATRLEVADKPPAVNLRLDARRLRRVFVNLAHNASDAMPDGGRILFRFSLNAREVVTEIEDNGPGIAPEIADRLFEVFATHGKLNGTGLGLSICKKIIQDHGGRIWARNEPGRGAVFAFALPLPK